MGLAQLKREAGDLTSAQLKKFDEWLRAELRRREISVNEKRQPSRKVSAKKKPADHKTYRKASVRCGKEKCKCASGDLHGPYWYAYWSEGGKTKSAYVGKRRPSHKDLKH